MFDDIRDVVEGDPEVYLTRYEPQILEEGS